MVDVGIQTLKPWVFVQSNPKITIQSCIQTELNRMHEQLCVETFIDNNDSNSNVIKNHKCSDLNFDCLFKFNSQMNYKSLQLLNISLIKLVHVLQGEVDGIQNELNKLKKI